jgi:hypothetical protein
VEKDLEVIGRKSFSEKVQQWESEYSHPEKRKIPLQRILAIAASIVLVGIIAINLLKPAGSGLYDEYYSPYPDMLSTRSINDAEINRAMEAYNSGSYAESADLLEAIESSDALVLLYLGIARMESNKLEEAVNTLLPLSTDERVGQQAQWYLALTYLKQGSEEAAKSVLRKIASDDSHYKQEEAIALIDKMK